MIKIDNILIVNTFGIGDVLFSTPMIKILAGSFPSAKINYICNQRTYGLLKNNPFLNDILIFEKDHFRVLAKNSKLRFVKKAFTFLKKVKSYKSDLMIDLSLNYQASLMGKLLGIPRRIGFDYRNRGRFLTDKINLEGFIDKHVMLYYLDLVNLFNIKGPNNAFIDIYTSKKDDLWADNFIATNNLNDKFIIGVIPGGGRSWGPDARYRRWPISNFAHITDNLIDELNVAVILFGDKSEAELCKRLESFMHNRIINMGGKTNIGQLMSLIKKCNVILCNEGGPLHIAVGLGIPTVSIFGPVDEKNYGPYSNDISQHIVISDRSKCKPCYSKFKHKKCDTLVCLNSISEDRVFNAVKTLIKNNEKFKNLIHTS